MDNPRLGHFFGVRNYLGGELNSPVVEWLNKGLMAVSSPGFKRASKAAAETPSPISSSALPLLRLVLTR
eukprot:1192776-Prorocentrum_minimum.AAC.1